MPSGGIRTHDLSRRATADLRLRPRGYCDRHTISNTDANCGDLRENKRARARKFMDVAKHVYTDANNIANKGCKEL